MVFTRKTHLVYPAHKITWQSQYCMNANKQSCPCMQTQTHTGKD